jgi:DNA-binding transcriptional LysR family regulator
MNLKQLDQFVVLADTLSFRSAAARLHISQPPLSVSIRNLEEEIGHKLFERSRRGVLLTDVGRAVLEDARGTLFHAAQFRRSAELAAAGQIGKLRVSFVPSSTIRLLPRAIAHFRSTHASVDLRLQEAGSSAIMVALRDGSIDVGIVREPVPGHPAISTRIVERERYLAALPAAHPLAQGKRLRLADLRSEPFILPSRAELSAAHLSIMFVCQQAGFVPNMVQEGEQAQTIVALVEAGLGVALVPSLWQDLAPRAVVFRKLSDVPQSEQGLAFACRKGEEQAVLVRAFRSSVDAAATPARPARAPSPAASARRHRHG